ncbi:23S rRNA (uracil(747)-C(5))-methyltransferase RlmC, partial [Klebsiella pneumoniae]
LAELVTRARLTPYDVPARRGELKHLIVTESPDGELMVRLVLRSREAVPRVRKHLPWLAEALPLAVLSVNLQPEHKAVLEGEVEEVL